MGFASDLAIGFKSFFGNVDIDDDFESGIVLSEDLKKSLNRINEQANSYDAKLKRSIAIHASDRIITAPKVPILGDLIARIKATKINSQLKKRLKENEKRNFDVLPQDDVVEQTLSTNPFTNPDGKSTVKTIAAGEIPDIPRDLGGEERTRKGH